MQYEYEYHLEIYSTHKNISRFILFFVIIQISQQQNKRTIVTTSDIFKWQKINFIPQYNWPANDPARGRQYKKY